jgi:MFS family permease
MAMSRRRVQALAALGSVGVAGYSSVAVPVLARSLEAELGLTASSLGALLSLGMGGGCVGGLTAGWLADRLNPLRSLRLSVLVCAIGCALAAAAGFAHELLWPALVVVGFGAGGAYVAAGGLLTALFPSRKRGSFSGLMVTSAAAGIVLPLIVAALDGLWQRGGLAFQWLLAAPYATVAMLLLLLSATLGGDQASEGEELAAEPGSRRERRLEPAIVVLVVALATIHGTADGVLFNWMPRYLGERFPDGPFPAGWVLSCYSAAYLAGRLALTFLPDRFARRALVVLPGLLAGPMVLAALHAPSMYLVTAGYALASLFYGLEFPALMGLAAQRYPDRFSTLFGWVSGTTVFAMAGVWGVGRWTEATGRMGPALSVAAGGFLVFGLLAGGWVAWDSRRERD